MASFLQGVTGKISFDDAGTILPHEHVMVDFVGADKTGPHRWNQDKVIEKMTPRLEEVKNHNVGTIFECTPMYLGRDPVLLKRLSQKTGIQLITNAGQYKEPYLPEESFRLSPGKLADQWCTEVRNGIDGTGVLPGFIKTAVDPGPLKQINITVLTAAAITSKQTGLTIATHTGKGEALTIIDLLEKSGVPAEKWIYVHAQNQDDPKILLEAAKRGAWIELDGVSESSEERHFKHLQLLLDHGFKDQVLLSHDAGWYRVGEPDGGDQTPYTRLFTGFIPMLIDQGIDKQVIQDIITVNPFNAYSLEG